MATPVKQIKGVTAELDAKLKGLNIVNTDQLLDAACEPAARRDLAKKLGVGESAVLELANRADLARVKGIGDVYADLLEQAGVDTVKELAHRVPANLHQKILDVNAQAKLTTRPPTQEQVQAWVEEAKGLPVVLRY